MRWTLCKRRSQERWHQFSGNSDGALAAWLRSILVNHLHDAMRRLGRQADEQQLRLELDQSSMRLEQWLMCGESTPRRKALRREDCSLLEIAMSNLRESQRTAIELRYIEGMSIQQISDRMQRTPASIGGLLQRGLTQLREQLDFND